MCEEVLWFINFDLTNIFMPVDGNELDGLLRLSNYEKSKCKIVVKGFKYGFPLCYEGDKSVKHRSEYFKSRVGSKLKLWNKLMKEVQAQRVAGPFENIPYKHYIQSPVELVPKDGGKKTRLIFHLSHPKGKGTSVNARIPKEKCTVKYPDFEDAVKLCLASERGCKVGKSDMA